MVLQNRALPRTLLNFSSRRLAKKCCNPSPSMSSVLAINHRQIHNEANYTKLRSPTSKDILHFQSILSQPDRSVLTHDDTSKYNQDWTGYYIGNSSLVLRPKSTQEVSSILRYCHDNFIGVVPQGGNTGLCGGSTPIHEEIVLSMERMNSIKGFTDEHSGILTSDAGVILENLHVYANEHGHLFPLDLGSKGTCQIGGNVSTNAGGSHYFRFGSLHATVVGLEVVLADGKVLHLNMSPDNEDQQADGSNRSGIHRKDNTGYDMKHLFIGGEGTLGIITKVAIACPTLPKSKNVCLLVVTSYDDVLTILKYAKEDLGETLSAVELMDSNTLQLVQEHGFSIEDSASRLLQSMLKPEETSVQSGTELSTTPSSLFVLVESQGSDIEADTNKMDSFITRLFDSGVIQNGSVAQDSKQINEIWRIREECNPSVARLGATYKFDVSLPINEYMDVSYEVEKKLQAESLDEVVCVWGHVADGNAHINVVTPGQHKKDANLSKQIETIVYDSVLKRRGSISAEHGLGQAKNDYLGQIKEKDVLDIMIQLKRTFDPHGILNPNKYLPKA